MQAVVRVPICPLLLRPDRRSERADEALFGMAVEILELCSAGWYRVRTHYRYEGFAQAEHLLFGAHATAEWAAAPKQAVLRRVCDVQSAPSVRARPLITLTRGALVAPLGEADQEGWQRVALPGGQTGYLRAGSLSPPPPDGEEALRSALAETALSYLGTPYRWGGKTPLGIDCSGLTSMAYLLNGVVIYRDASIREDFPIHQIPRGSLGKGDLLFFPGHIALYLGEGRYVHSTARTGSDGVVINSLDPDDPLFRPDLAENLTHCGSLF